MPDTPWKRLERKVAESFSMFLSGGKCRTVLSRQALWGRMVERIYGDLAIHPACPKEWFAAAKWFMEWAHVDAKNRQAFRIAGLLTQKKPPFFQWWDKLTGESPNKMRFMVLLDKASRTQVIAFGTREDELIEKSIGCWRGAIPNIHMRRLDIYGKIESIYLCQFEQFLKRIDPSLLGFNGGGSGTVKSPETVGKKES